MKGFTLSIDYADEPQSKGFDAEILLDFLKCLSHLTYLTLQLWSLSNPFELAWLKPHVQTLERLFISIGTSTRTLVGAFDHQILPLEDLTRLAELSRSFNNLPSLCPRSTCSAQIRLKKLRIFLTW